MVYANGYEFWNDIVARYSIEMAYEILERYMSTPLLVNNMADEDEFCRELCTAAGVQECIRPRPWCGEPTE